MRPTDTPPLVLFPPEDRDAAPMRADPRTVESAPISNGRLVATRALLFVRARVSELVGSLGPGLITGASDDDASGISTYSMAGQVSDIPSCGPLCFRFL